MRVKKRDGTFADVCLRQIQERIQGLAHGLQVDVATLAQRTVASLTDGIETSYLDTVAASSAFDMYTTHTDYERIAVRLTVDNMHRMQTRPFSEAMRTLHRCGRLSDVFMDYVAAHASNLDAMIDRTRDMNLSYFGVKTLINNKYLLRDTGGSIVEIPGYLWMRVAVALHHGESDTLHNVKDCYDALSNLKYTHATPTLFNAGMKQCQYASCFLMSLCEDSVEGIYQSLSECAKISKHAGGIGLHMHNLRAAGSEIRSTGCPSEGLLPTLRVFNETSKLVRQAGKRPGSIAIYMSPDHADIESFVDMRRNHGDEHFKCRELFSALWVPDLFMECVINDGDWHLFSPDTAPGLNDVYGDEYRALYAKYVSEKRYVKSLSARSLFIHVVQAQIETGTPYVLYKDAINRHNNQSNVGVVRSSNLCCEITEVSDPDTIAVCNLASLCLPRFIQNGTIDFAALGTMTRQVVRTLDEVIDRTMYPLPKARKSNTATRPLGIGVQGWQTLLFELRIPFDSEAARKLNVRVFAEIYYNAWMESACLARSKGAYPKFDGSPMSRGILHADGFGNKLPPELDWDTLRRTVAQGTRHSLITCVMPTASTSQIAGNTEACEPLSSNIYVRRTQAGDYVNVNKYLVADLQRIGRWNKQTRDDIIQQDGSVQSLSVPDDIKRLYKTAYEISQKAIIDQAAERMPFIDQSQSMNLFLKTPTVEQVTSMHMYAFSKGLKTGQYYLRSRPRTRPQQLSIAPKTDVVPTEYCASCTA